MVFWIVALAVFVAAFWLLREIMLPFVAGLVLAYLLDPLANRLERAGLSRSVAALVIVGVFIVTAVFVAALLVPVLASQLAGLAEKLPAYATRVHAVITDPSRPWLVKIVGAGLGEGNIGDMVQQATGGLASFLRSLWSGGQALLSIFSLVIVTPVVAFYLIWDWNRIVAAIDGWLPRPYAPVIRRLAAEMDNAIAGFVRGQTVICLILAALYAAGYSVIGLNFGFVIGLATGIATFVPYAGSLAGMVLAVSVAVAQFWPDWVPIVSVLGLSVVLQALEGYVLAPNLVGRVIGLHPVWLMFALFAASYLLGFLGLLIAVPLAAAIAVLVRFGLAQYLSSPLYSGETLPPP